MKIECHNCHKYLGNIKEGSQLRKGMVFLCRSCGGMAMYNDGAKQGFDLMDMIMKAGGKHDRQ